MMSYFLKNPEIDFHCWHVCNSWKCI